MDKALTLPHRPNLDARITKLEEDAVKMRKLLDDANALCTLECPDCFFLYRCTVEDRECPKCKIRRRDGVER